MGSAPEKEPLRFETEIMIRESDLDTFGHVNNAVYLRILEEARWEIITPRGYGLEKVRELGAGPTILEIHLQFRRELRLREKVKVRSWITEAEGKIQKMRQVIVNANGEEACIADFVFGLFDTKLRRLIEPTPEWRAAIGLK